MINRPVPAVSGSPAVLGPAGWHGPTDIQTLAGLAGTYLWTINPYYPTLVSFRFNPGAEGFQGTYELRVGLVPADQGPFICSPVSAAGPAVVVFKPGTADARYFVISGMFTDIGWKVYFILLNEYTGTGQVQSSFTGLRLV